MDQAVMAAAASVQDAVQMISAHKFESALLVMRTQSHKKLAKLLAMVLGRHDTSSGELAALMGRLGDKLVQGHVFDAKHSRAYSLGGDPSYGLRGGYHYFKPVGWLRYSLHVENFSLYKDWPVAYHGTRSQSVVSILNVGLRRPGEHGVTSLHGQTYSDTKKSIYVSPSIEYAAFPVYANLFELHQGDHWGQLVLQCRVRPGAFIEKPGSLGNKYWPQHVRFDPNFDRLEGLEWLLEDPNDIVVYGIMVREFGPRADATVHGELVRQVSHGQKGPEFEWTRLRSEDFEKRKLFIHK
eukprot:gnl/TRDRNA2_/TRDRNA2_174810_c1_seq17.p1 gnl/TRDRNA2_/TRDRNA2_174810_c1~~gnl/TRDRNA2_/TRDRNA2_174810_c1_seq17.p1  ORF type:complete len:307 (-),score=31.80 gnl/TRDRNA2_/TRDRNA2_174810_c1_seq17:106-993(-)